MKSESLGEFSLDELKKSAKQVDLLLRKRERARTDLIAFARFNNSKYDVAPHHREIAKSLEDIANGTLRHLIISVCPRAGKSELVSRLFPAFYFGNNSNKEVIAVTRSVEFAKKFSHSVRSLMESVKYKSLFDKGLDENSRALELWRTKDKNSYTALGVGSGITGEGADLLILDDLYSGSSEEVYNPAFRERVWQWYATEAYTRLSPNGAVVLIGTRWHEDDQIGKLLSRDNADGHWRVLNFPAIDEAGNALWPKRWSYERLMEIKRLQTDEMWNTVYQQQPLPESGILFKSDWLKYYDELPSDLKMYGASDYATTSGGGDYTEHGICGIDQDGIVYVVDWWRDRVAVDKWIEIQCDLMARHSPYYWFGESGQIRRSTEPFLVKRMRERGISCRLEWFPSFQDKEARLRLFLALMSMGRVRFPRNSAWKDILIGQLLKFPNGRYDDGVDVLSLFGRGLALMKNYGNNSKIVPLRPPVRAASGNRWML